MGNGGGNSGSNLSNLGKKWMLMRKRVIWIRVYGVPFHAWSNDFFDSLASRLGSFICLDENTMSGTNMDIARFMIRVNSGFILPETLEVAIDGVHFNLILREDSYGS